MVDGDAPGWHGKLPSLGDFASRRLPHEFVEAWDAWLAGGLAALKNADPGWLDGYLASPIWRFLLLPGVLPGEVGRQAWTGVLMPSVDRAGRYFPFTMALALTRVPRDSEGFTTLHRWLRQLDDLAADALQDDWTVPQLEAELERIRPPDMAPGRADPSLARTGAPLSMPIDSAADVTTLLTEDAFGIWQTVASGQAFWWCEPGADAGRLVVTRGLPAGRDVGNLLGAVAGAPASATTPIFPSSSAGPG